MRAAAKVADKATARAIKKYSEGLVTDEDDLTGVLIGRLDAAFDGQVGALTWSSSIVRHRRGVAAQEKRIGADMIIHVSLMTPLQNYSKAVLVQAKRHEPAGQMTRNDQAELQKQCGKMLEISPASFVFNYAQRGMRCGSASKIKGSSNRDLYDACNWTSYRFFLELFRSPIGDPKLTSAYVSDLPVPLILELSAEGDIHSE